VRKEVVVSSILAKAPMEKQVDGSWDLVTEGGKTLLCVRCPGCAKIIPLDEGYEVRFGELLPCIVHHCGFHEYVYLRGWNRTHDRIWERAKIRSLLELRKRLRRIEAGLEQEWTCSVSTGYPCISFYRGRATDNFIQILMVQMEHRKRYRYAYARLGGVDIQPRLNHVGPKALHFYNSICDGRIALLLGKDMPRLRKKVDIQSGERP